MKTLILIDGENFVHKLVKVLTGNGLIKERKDLKAYNLVKLLQMLLPEHNLKEAQINYYAAKVRLVKEPAALRRKTAEMARWNSYWASNLANQGIAYIKSGNLQVRDSKLCTHCSKKSLVLQEKGVDVRLAVDMVSGASKQTRVILLSSDSDIAPAVLAAKQKGSKVTYIGFDFAMNLGLSAAADLTRSITPQLVQQAFKSTFGKKKV